MIKAHYQDMAYGQIHYRKSGRVGAPQLVLIHQSPSSSVMYETMMGELADDFDIIAPDTPGFGLSDTPPSRSVDAITDIYIEFLRSLGVQGANIFGHHTGAVFAGTIAARATDICSRLALCGPPLLDAEYREKLPTLAMDEPPTPDGGYLIRMWKKFGRKANDIGPDIIQREMVQAMYCGANNKRMYQAISDHDLEQDLNRISVPTLVFAGSEDVLLPRLQPAHEAIAGSDKAVIPGGASYICDTHAPELAKLLRDFFLKDGDGS